MRITQGTFSFLPDFTEEQVKAQIQYCLENGWPVSIEFTGDPHPRNVYWEMWGLPMFDVQDVEAILFQLRKYREAHPDLYIRINGFDRSLNRATTVLSFIVNRPRQEPEFHVERTEFEDRQLKYSIKRRPE